MHGTHDKTIRCDTCAIRHGSVCGSLHEGEIDRLNAIAHHKTFQPGQTIHADKQQFQFFGNIISGVVKLTKTLADGREQIVGLQFASDFLGRPYRAHSPFHAEAVTKVHLCTYEKGQFERLAQDLKGLEHRLFENTMDELDAAQEWMLVLGRKSAGEKVATLLLMIARRMESIGCKHSMQPTREKRFELPLTRAEIADFLGLTIETVSRQFSKLKTAGIIGLDGTRGLIIRDMNRLIAASEVRDDD